MVPRIITGCTKYYLGVHAKTESPLFAIDGINEELALGNVKTTDERDPVRNCQ